MSQNKSHSKTYISSSCVKHEKILGSIRELNSVGIRAIELSGGTKPYTDMETDLVQMKKEGVDLMLHNYFPPPQEDFVLNLGSSNKQIYHKSKEHCKRAIDLSIKLGSTKYAFHAGFFIDIKVSEIGKKLGHSKLTDKSLSFDRFCSAYEELKILAGNDVQLYVENNVFSRSNKETFDGENPLMFTDLESYLELKNKVDFIPLLDVAHLKVSTKSLEKDFEKELTELSRLTDYIHISDNDGTHDTNGYFDNESPLASQLAKLEWHNKTVTLEVYEDLDLVLGSRDNFQGIANG